MGTVSQTVGYRASADVTDTIMGAFETLRDEVRAGIEKLNRDKAIIVGAVLAASDCQWAPCGCRFEAGWDADRVLEQIFTSAKRCSSDAARALVGSGLSAKVCIDQDA